MASLEIYEKATSPTYNAAGSSIQVTNTSEIYNKWYAAVQKYMSDAKASSTAELGVWTPTGTTHEGTSVPATPASQSGIPFGACGSGSSGAALAAGGTAAISYKFFSSTATAEYRWVQDRTYIPQGMDYFRKESPPYYTYDSSIGAAALATFTAPEIILYDSQDPAAHGNAIQAIMDSMPVGASLGRFNRPDWPHEPIDVYLAAGSYVGFYSGGNGFIQAFVSVTSAATATMGAVGPTHQLTAWWNYSAHPGDTEQLGQWHLERRLSTPVMGSIACATAEYISSSAPDFDPAGTPPKISVKLDAIHAAGTPGPYMNIGQACGSGAIVKAYDSLAGLNTLYPEPIPGYNKAGAYHPAVEFNYITPGSTFFLQQGSYTLGYNDLAGAYVLDIQLKKWGKYKHTYKCLVPFYSANSVNPSLIPYDDLGMSAGLLHADGKIYAFDHIPSEGYIKYGKMGYYRLGNCHFLEARVDFRSFASGILTIDSSLDGRYVDPAISLVTNFSDELTCRVYPNIRAKWITLKVSGKYDLQYMEIRGNISGRR